MWQVKISHEASRIFESDELTVEDRLVIQRWAEVVQKRGPEALKWHPTRWMDHELHGKWDGHRSSRFSYSGRIIYRIEDHVVTVVVVRITPNHDYRR